MADDLIPRVLEGDVLVAGVLRSQNDEFALGDIVTRDGSDLHLVAALTDDGFSGEFLCVRAPDTGWIAVGETESNLARRYRFVRTPATGEFEVSSTPSKRSLVQQ